MRLPLRLGLLLVPASLLPALASLPPTGAADRKADESTPPAADFPVHRGDHVSLIGNALADRMQHDGWLETYFQGRFPRHNLSFRNLGFAGDEVALRPRSERFGSPDDWLTRTKTDVVLAFFGYNESFAGEKGLPKFKRDLDTFVQHTLAQKYNGKSAPRLVLFSPVAHENLHDRNLPDGSENNRRLEKYTAAIAEVAKAHKVRFVDLFHPTRDLYPKSKKPWTINGVHLNAHGNHQLARLIDKALFPKAPGPKRDPKAMEKLRRAVLDKDFYWFNRYRTVDGYNVFGGRADLRYVDGISNRTVMQREMQVLDVMTANRDKRVWAVARGGDLKVDDRNTPPFIPVKTNHPGKLPGGKHLFLDPEKAIGRMTVAKGMKVNLFASEKDFPELANPVQMAWDTRGRLWVAAWPTYPHWRPKEPMNDKILILEDTDGDGKADKCTVFAKGLHCPTGMELYGDGALVAQAPDLMFLRDTDGDGKADRAVRMLGGLDSADTHHTANSFVFDPGGALYFQEGVFHHTQVESPWAAPKRCANAGVYRFEPRTYKFEVYISHGFANPHGHVFDSWGQDIVVDGTGAQPYHAALFSGDTDYPHKHPSPPQVYKQRTRPCPGIEVLSSRHFPEEMQGDLLVANVIGVQGILRYKIKDKGASFAGTEAEPILSSSDPNFRPSDIKVGPDGALYFLDWHNPIIGHMQHHLRDPSRDRTHGRIYRVTYPGRPLLRPKKIAGEPVAKLLDLLKEPEDRVRYRARIELGGRPTDKVIAAVKAWADKLDKKDPQYEHNLLEALWVHQRHNVVNEDLLKRLLRSPDFRARAAATRVLCYWRDRVRDPLELLRVQVNDDHPRVRLEAIRALSFFRDEKALAVAVEMLAHPDDEYLRYTFNETLATLERRLGTGGKLDRKNVASGLLRMLEKGRVSADRKPVLIETICRHGGPKDLQVIWDKARATGGYPADLRGRVLDWLADAAVTRRVRPEFDPNDVGKLLASAKGELLPEAIRLATAWKVKASAPQLGKIARDPKSDPEARFAAVDGLASFDDAESRKTLHALAKAPTPAPVRFRAVVALSTVDLEFAATAAAHAIVDSKESDDLSPVVEAFLTRKGGPEKLASALGKEKVKADTAKRILRAMFLAGRDDAVLMAVVSKFAGLDAEFRKPTPKEVEALAAEVRAKGDAARGERIFRRADLGCMKCHAINKAGGHVGPDLGPLGSSSPLDYVITSILDPNASIKEEYLTKVITTGTGRVVTGIVVERNKNRVVLKDATGKLVRIPAAEVEEEANGKSLMPEGVTRILTRGELLDLVRFVSELGKGRYAAPAVPTVRRWKRLKNVPRELRAGAPNRDVLRDTLLHSSPAAWEDVYAMVDGTLPLDELRRAGRSEVLYLQGEVLVRREGEVEVKLDSTVPATLWVDEEAIDRPGKRVVRLTPGLHFITVRVAPGEAKAPTLKAEVRTPPASAVVYELVTAE
jgi:putative heme-binding domain-containing protein